MTAVLAGLPTVATSASLGAVGNKVEMYGEAPINSCSSLCYVNFPQNTTGKVIKIENVTCQVEVRPATLDVSFAWVGTSNTPGSAGNFLKKSYFPERSVANDGTMAVHALASRPGMLLGAGKYLQVMFSVYGSVNASCSASGVYAL